MSIWNKRLDTRKKEILNKDLEVDVLIVGAGITGMTTAYYLRNCKDVCIVDMNYIGSGVTLNTTAKINYFQERIYTKIEGITNTRAAVDYLKSQKYAIENIEKIIRLENIDCDFVKVPSFVFANKKSEIIKLEKEVNFLRKNGIDVEERDMPCKVKSFKSYCVKDTYIFNPIKYLIGLYNIIKKNNVMIYENTKIWNIKKEEDKYICYSEKYNIRAKKVIFSCHYPYFIIPFLLPLKSYIEKSYIIVSKVKEDKKFTCISSSSPVYSCRFYSDDNATYQICLGRSHNTSVNQDDEYNFKMVKSMFKLKDRDIVMKYSNMDIITSDYMPYIGNLKENIYIAVGYNTWGMTNGILAAKIISDMILNKKNQYSDLFNPKRINASNILSFPYILYSQTKSFLGPKMNKNKPWYSNKVSFVKKDGKSLGIYKDSSGFSHIIYNKCPHFGCSLIFNEEEKTWDCPCHSSRFDIDGKCIKGPSLYDISYKNDK